MSSGTPFNKSKVLFGSMLLSDLINNILLSVLMFQPSFNEKTQLKLKQEVDAKRCPGMLVIFCVISDAVSYCNSCRLVPGKVQPQLHHHDIVTGMPERSILET
jgi:hypothetical protein